MAFHGENPDQRLNGRGRCRFRIPSEPISFWCLRALVVMDFSEQG
jgi:hypothetical protein